MKGTQHDLYCFMCGKKWGSVEHSGGGKKVKWCEDCSRVPHYCLKCFYEGKGKRSLSSSHTVEGGDDDTFYPCKGDISKKSPLWGGVPSGDGKSPRGAPSPREDYSYYDPTCKMCGSEHIGKPCKEKQCRDCQTKGSPCGECEEKTWRTGLLNLLESMDNRGFQTASIEYLRKHFT